MRKRMINPEFFTDGELVEGLDVGGRLFYIGLWCVADDSGVFEWSPLTLKMKIFPGDDISRTCLENYLTRLEEMGKVRRFEANGKVYGWLVNFLKHQKVDKPGPPNHPLPPWLRFNQEGKERHKWFYEVVEDVSTTFREHVEDTSCPEEKLREEKRSEVNKNTSAAADLPPEPDGSADSVSQPGGAQSQGSGKGQKTPAEKPGNEYTAEFEEFWSHYPRRVEKRAAFKAWKTRLKEGYKPQQLIIAAKNYASYCRLQGTEQRFIKHPSTFLGPNKPFEEFINGPPDNVIALEYHKKGWMNGEKCPADHVQHRSEYNFGF